MSLITVNRFAAANALSPVIEGQWLDAAGRQVSGHPGTWHTLRYTLESGESFDLERTDLEHADPRWAFGDAEFTDFTQEENPDVND